MDYQTHPQKIHEHEQKWAELKSQFLANNPCCPADGHKLVLSENSDSDVTCSVCGTEYYIVNDSLEPLPF